MADDKKKPKLRLIDCLKQSLANEPPAPCEGEDLAATMLKVAQDCSPSVPETQTAEIIDLEMRRALDGEIGADETSPVTVLKIAAMDAEALGDRVKKCYITLIVEDETTYSTTNYRAKLNRIEEVAFRQLGVQEVIDGWRGFSSRGPED